MRPAPTFLRPGPISPDLQAVTHSGSAVEPEKKALRFIKA
jgi:hypothetical protein